MAIDSTSSDKPRAHHKPGRGLLSSFFFPSVNRYYLARVATVAALAYLFFGHVCIPCRIGGKSMEPTYANGGFMFCWRPRYWIHRPRPGQVVMVRLAGRRVMYLKRVVAQGGDRVAFRGGQLFVNGEEKLEPYVKGPCDWNLGERKVPAGHVYVIGDNRSMPMAQHQFGSVALERIEGGPLW